MVKVLHLKWYAWALLSFQFLLNLIVVCTTTSGLFHRSFSSPFIPKYAACLFFLKSFIIIIPALSCCTAIILLLFKKKIGWIIILIVLIWHTLSFLKFFFIGPPADHPMIYVTLLIQLLTIFVLCSKKIRVEFAVKSSDYIYIALFPLLLILTDIFSYEISVFLS